MYSGHAGSANTEHNIGVQKQYILTHVYMAHTWYTQNTQNLHSETLAHMHILTLTQMETEIHAKYAHRHMPNVHTQSYMHIH